MSQSHVTSDEDQIDEKDQHSNDFDSSNPKIEAPTLTFSNPEKKRKNTSKIEKKMKKKKKKFKVAPGSEVPETGFYSALHTLLSREPVGDEKILPGVVAIDIDEEDDKKKSQNIEKMHKKLLATKGHDPNPKFDGFDLQMKVIATRGVVKLFNSTRKFQIEREKKAKEREGLTKAKFIEIVAQSKPKQQAVSQPKKQTPINSKWGVLADDFALNPEEEAEINKGKGMKSQPKELELEIETESFINPETSAIIKDFGFGTLLIGTDLETEVLRNLKMEKERESKSTQIK